MIISANFDEFVSEINSGFKEFAGEVNSAIEGAFEYGWEKVVSKTRVDTGRARYSWSLVVNGEGLVEVPAVRSGERFYPDPTLAPISFDVLAEDTLQLGNAVEYIEHLEYGSRTTEADLMLTSTIPNIKRSLNIRLTNIRKKQ